MDTPYWELESKSRFFLSARLDLALDYTAASQCSNTRRGPAQAAREKSCSGLYNDNE